MEADGTQLRYPAVRLEHDDRRSGLDVRAKVEPFPDRLPPDLLAPGAEVFRPGQPNMAADNGRLARVEEIDVHAKRQVVLPILTQLTEPDEQSDQQGKRAEEALDVPEPAGPVIGWVGAGRGGERR